MNKKNIACFTQRCLRALVTINFSEWNKHFQCNVSAKLKQTETDRQRLIFKVGDREERRYRKKKLGIGGK